MAIFSIIPQSGPNGEFLQDALYKAFGDTKCLTLGNGCWLVSASGTAQDISTQIGLTEGAVGSAIVLEVSSYYGRANPAIWSWIKTNWEGPSLG